MSIFRGAGVAIVTPMKENLEVNYEKLEELIQFQIDNGTDCIVIAGKGHEDYQIFKDKTIHFSDREIACELLGVKCD